MGLEAFSKDFATATFSIDGCRAVQNTSASYEIKTFHEVRIENYLSLGS